MNTEFIIRLEGQFHFHKLPFACDLIVNKINDYKVASKEFRRILVTDRDIFKRTSPEKIISSL